MELFFFYGATCALKVRFAIREMEAVVTERVVVRSDLTKPEYLRLNPKGVVPTLVVEGQPIVESSTIMRFLSETMENRLQPKDRLLRAGMNNWLKAMDEVMFPAIGYLTLGITGRKALNQLSDDDLRSRMDRVSANLAVSAQRFDAIRLGAESRSVIGAFQSLTKQIKAMDESLAARTFLAGDSYTLADAAVAPIFVRLEEFGIADWWTSKLPNVLRWWSDIRARDSYASAVLDTPNPESGAYSRDFGELHSALRDRLRSFIH